MAVHNQLILYAQVVKPPMITKDDDGNYLRGVLSVMVAPGKRDIGIVSRKQDLSNVKYETLPIVTEDKTVLAVMDQLKENDIITVKGTLTTKNVIKKKKCPVCGKVHKKNGVLTFVHPINLHIERSDVSKEEGIEMLKSNCEMSNLAIVVGTICKPPSLIETKGKNNMAAHFPIAIDRKYFIAEDNVETREDYPWVNIYGQSKVEDLMLRCKVGTIVMVDGFIRTRKLPKLTIDCDDEMCPGQIEWNDWTIDMIAYSLEYMSNWKTDEDLAAENEAASKKIHEKLFGLKEEGEEQEG